MKHHCRSAQLWRMYSRDLAVLRFYLHTHTFIRNRNEPLPSQPQLSWYSFTDPGGIKGLSRPWCEIAPAEIRTSNLLIANPALYYTATSAPQLDTPIIDCYG